MHGVKKEKYTEAVAKARRLAELQRLAEYQELATKVSQFKTQGILSDEALEVTGRLIGFNPEYYSLWNFRRTIFLDRIKTRPTEEVQGTFETELKFLIGAIQSHPKSYWVWHHRVWVMEHIPSPDYLYELHLCSKMLELDSRNFHCWDYRRRMLTHIEKLGPKDELEFTFQKISQNFSNYSAFHLRSNLLPLVYPSNDSKVQQEILENELELVRNAVFTEPADQSPWLYHRWLLAQYFHGSGAPSSNSSPSSSFNQEALQKELASITELLELEPDSKWPLLTSALIRHLLGDYETSIHFLDKLMSVDPYRIHYYQDLRSEVVLDQLTHSLHTQILESVEIIEMELTCLYHLERLATVQRVNLSQNKLSKTEGIFKLTSVEELILDDNKIPKLQGFKNLSKLKILSLKNNEIHTPENLSDLFNSSALESLDLQGNPITQLKDYRKEIQKHLPHLKSLDGVPL